MEGLPTFSSSSDSDASSGSDSDSDSGPKVLQLGDVVLVGSEDRIAPGSTVDQLWSKARSERLAPLLRTHALQGHGSELRALLTLAQVQHQAEAEAAADGGGDSAGASLAAWFRSRLLARCKAAAADVRTLLVDLPGAMLLRPAALKQLLRRLCRLEAAAVAAAGLKDSAVEVRDCSAAAEPQLVDSQSATAPTAAATSLPLHPLLCPLHPPLAGCAGGAGTAR